jgi:hypothetical protein
MDLGSLFDLDGRNAVENPPKRMTWSDPNARFLSDWTINVTTKGVQESDSSSESTTYHVHKVIVSAGPRGSRYFRKLFKTIGLV